MALNVSDVIDKLLDNASVGKVVTDVGAGFALSISCVLGVGLLTGISVVPLDRSKELNAIKDNETYVLCVQKAELEPLLNAAAEVEKLDKVTITPRCNDVRRTSDAAATNQAGRDEALRAADELYRLAERRIALLAARLTTLDTKIEAFTKPANADRKTYEPLLDERVPFARVHDQLISQKDLIDTQQQRVSTAENQLADARSFSVNMEGFTNNISAVLAFSVVLGVVLSQMNRLIFVNWIYESILKTRYPKLAKGTRSPNTRLLNKTEYDETVSNYYRYVEGSINMIVPVIAFGAVAPRFVDAKLQAVGPFWIWVWLLTSALVAGLLIVSGYKTYVTFREKESAITAPPPPPPPPQQQ